MTTRRLPGQEHFLLDYLRHLSRHRNGRGAVHIHLSGLLPANRREQHIRIAATAFESLVRALQGQVFVLSNTDLMFIFKDSCLGDVEGAVVRLRFLFSDDPLLADSGRERPGAFATWYRLDQDYDTLLALAKALGEDERDRRMAEQASQTIEHKSSAPSGEPLTPLLLARMEEVLGQADLANLLRRQTVCSIVDKASPQPTFSEVFVSIGDLRDTVLPHGDLTSDRWLFQHLTETLDRRVLSMLNKHDDRTLTGHISINLNVSTLLSPDFLVFDDNVRAGMRDTIVLELQTIDIFADPGAYLFARDFAHERGYRICIDGLTHLTLPFIDRDRLDADLVKIYWHPEMGDQDQVASLVEAVDRCGPSRIILARCESRQAVEFGQSLGITLFQGRFIEAMLSDETRRRGSLRNR